MIAAVILAAGTSSRVGRPKQLLLFQGRPIIQHVIDAATAAKVDEIIVVLGHAAEEVLSGFELRPPARVVINPDYEAGQSASLRIGLRSLGHHVKAAVILLGDQPGVSIEAIRAVVDAYERTGERVVRAVYGGEPGHPVLFDRRVWREAEAIEGDRGARDLLAQHPEWVVEVPFEGKPPPDLDTWDDYKRLTEKTDG